MKSWNLTITGRRKCELIQKEVEPLQDDQIRCRAIKSLISTGSEIYHYQGEVDSYQHWAELFDKPFTTGYSMAAEVIEVGKDVTGYKKGDLVFAQMFQEQIFNISPEFVSHKPEDIDLEEVCWSTILRTGVYSAWKGNVTIGRTVLVIGLGVFGTCVVQACKAAGASKIIAVDPSQKRCEIAAKVGATHTIPKRIQDVSIGEIIAITGARFEDPEHPDARRSDGSLRIVDGFLPDTVVDATGDPTALRTACEMTRNDGDVVLISDPPKISEQIVGTNILIGYLNIHGMYINMMTCQPNAFYPKTWQDSHEIVYDLIRKGVFDVKSMNTSIYPVTEGPAVYEMLCKDRSNELGVLLDWTVLR